MITSILDNDLYKFTMMNAVLKKAPDARVSYKFYNRGKHIFNEDFHSEIDSAILSMEDLEITDEELDFLRKSCPFFDEPFLAYLKNFRFDPFNISIRGKEDLTLTVNGNWAETILWEVPLMAMISELYYKHVDTDWSYHDSATIKEKCNLLRDCKYAEFGTRRRRGYDVHDSVIAELKTWSYNNDLVGTSNVHFAMKYGLKPIGTMAHEWVMGMSVLEGLRHANRFAMQAWNDVYRGRLGIALADTYGSDAFFDDFDGTLARTFDGVRHDSGDPIAFMEKTIDFYHKMGIDPSSKTIVFSDGLDPKKAKLLQLHCDVAKINCSFGIGTNFTNDFKDSPAMNMVIKLDSMNGVPVVKLSDEPGKVTGNPKAVDVAKWTFGVEDE